MVQNMMQLEGTKHTLSRDCLRAELDVKCPHMGLTTWKKAPDGRVHEI